MRTAMLIGALLVAGTVHAANVSTLDRMVKQGQKLARGDAEKAKLLCVCHLGDGSTRLGYLSSFAASFPVATQVHVICLVPTYGADGAIRLTENCSGLGFFEIIK